MEVKDIRERISGAVAARGCFIVDVRVSRDNDVTLTVEKEEGIMDLEDCAALSGEFEALYDREIEDYSLTVSSAGLDQPFKVLRQFEKAVGTRVEAAFKGGKKVVATMTAACEESVTLEYVALEAVEGSKKKAKVAHSDVVPMSELTSVRPHIEFE